MHVYMGGRVDGVVGGCWRDLLQPKALAYHGGADKGQHGHKGAGGEHNWVLEGEKVVAVAWRGGDGERGKKGGGG